MLIREVKRSLDGGEQAFICEALDVSPSRFAVVKFETERAYSDGPVQLPAGPKTTLGFFWQDRHYVLYRFMARGSRLLGHRFDICEEVSISQQEIIWKDLVLDLWVDPSGCIHVLDERELAAWRQRGLLTDRQWAVVQQTRKHLLDSYRETIAGMHDLVTSLGFLRSEP